MGSSLKYFLVAVCLFGLYLITAPGEVNHQNKTLLDQADITKVSRIKISSGEESTTFLFSDGSWQIQEFDNFPADSSRVKALLLELSGISLTPELPLSEEISEEWGLTADAHREKEAAYQLELGDKTLLFGKKDDRYAVKLSDGKKGVLLARDIIRKADPESWITKLVNLGESEKLPVEQLRVDENGELVTEFSIVGNEEGNLEFSGEVEEFSQLLFDEFTGLLADIRIIKPLAEMPEGVILAGVSKFTGVNNSYEVKRYFGEDKYYMEIVADPGELWYEDWVFEIPGYIYNRANMDFEEISTP